MVRPRNRAERRRRNAIAQDLGSRKYQQRIVRRRRGDNPEEDWEEAVQEYHNRARQPSLNELPDKYTDD